MAKKKAAAKAPPVDLAAAATPEPEHELVTTSDTGAGLLRVKDPSTGEIHSMPREDARMRVFRDGWLPVDVTTGRDILAGQLNREKSNAAEGLAYGAAKGLTGGLIDFLAPTGSHEARALRGIEEENPVSNVVGEVGGTLLPFTGALKAAKLATLPGLAEEAGAAVTRGLAGEGAGVAGRIGARAAGMGLEGGVYGVTGELRRSHIDDTPLTADKIGFGFLAGALPGAILGVPVGAVEGVAGSLGRRYAQRGAAARDAVLAPGVSDADANLIRQRDFGGPDQPGLLEVWQSSVHPRGGTPDQFQLLNDKGPVGEQIRDEVFFSGEKLRQDAVSEAATSFDQLRDADSEMIGNWAGRMKREWVRKLVPSGASPTDIDQMILGAMNVPEGVTRAPEIEQLAQTVSRQVRKDPEAAAELLATLGTSPEKVQGVVIDGLVARNNDTAAIIGKYLKEVGAPEIGTQTWRSEALRQIDGFGDELEQFEVGHRGYTGAKGGKMKELRGLLAGVREEVTQGTRGEVAGELDWLKKRLGKYAKPDEYLGVEDDMTRAVRRWHEDVRQNLENPNYWGDDFALMQQNVNSLLHKRLARADSYWNTFFTDAGVPDPKNPWANLKRADPVKIGSAVSKFNEPAHDAEFQLTLQHIKEGRDMTGMLRQYFHGDEGKLAAWEKAADSAENAIKRAKVLASRVEQGKALTAGGIGGHGMARTAIGYLLGGPAGAAASMVAGAAMNPGRLLHARALLERLMRNSEGRIARGVAGLLTSGKRAVSSVRNPTTALAAEAVTSLLQTKSPEKRAKEYHATLGELADATRPGRMEEALTRLTPVGAHVPNAVAVAADRYRNAVMIVLSRAPALPTMNFLGDEDLPYISDDALDKWEQTYRGALDPISVLEAAKTGELTPEMVSAADASAPELMAHIREVIVQAVADSGPKFSYDRKVQMSILFKLPLDPSMTPDYIGAMQTLHRARFQEGIGPQSRRTFDETGVNEDYRSKGDQLEKEDVPR